MFWLKCVFVCEHACVCRSRSQLTVSAFRQKHLRCPSRRRVSSIFSLKDFRNASNHPSLLGVCPLRPRQQLEVYHPQTPEPDTNRWVYYEPQACPRPRREKTKKGKGEQRQWWGGAVRGRREQTVLLVKDSAGCPPVWADAGCWPSQGLARASLGRRCVASLGFALRARLSTGAARFLQRV